LTRDATGPAGAVVHYTPPAVTDHANPMDPTVAVCTPPSGSTFPIGTTTVTCTASDALDYNSPVSSTFTVHVVGAPGQLAALYWDVRDYGPALANTVRIAGEAVDNANTPRACLALDAFIVEVATRIPPFPPVERAYLIAAAAQIQAVLACGDSWIP
jgi:HYR domain